MSKPIVSAIPEPRMSTISASDVSPIPEKEWTIMFLLAGDGGISSGMISQLKAITDAGFEENTNVLIYFDPNCNGINARIFNVNDKRRKGFVDKKTNRHTLIGDGRDPFVRNIADDTIWPGLPQMPASASLRYFLTYSRNTFPAKNYLLFLMGHGQIVANDAFLPDSDDGSAITLTELGTILKEFSTEVRKKDEQFHLVGFHSCSMNSVEVAYELQGTARFMLGSQGLTFANSSPYRQLLKKIFLAIERPENRSAPANGYPNKTVQEILDGIQDLTFYNSVDFWLAGFSSDMSICSLDPDKVDSLSAPLEELAVQLTTGLADSTSKGQILRAHLESQSYYVENYIDLFDFCHQLQELGPSTAIWDACEGVKRVLQTKDLTQEPAPPGGYQRLVVYSDFFGPAYQYSYGLSIYFPWRAPEQKILNRYANYAFHQKAGAKWLDFLNHYFEETRRKVRSTGPMPGRSNGHIHMQKQLTPAEWASLSESELLAVGRPSEKSGSALATNPSGSDKSGSALATDPSGSDKSGSALATDPSGSDKSGSALATNPNGSDKSGSALATNPNGSDKSSSALDDASPSDKSGGAVGLFGLTVIKNFENPPDLVVTSRPKGHPWDGPRTGRTQAA